MNENLDMLFELLNFNCNGNSKFSFLTDEFSNNTV